MPTYMALLSAQGTCCIETVLNEREYADPKIRARIEEDARKARAAKILPDPPVPGTWTDVSDNEAVIALMAPGD